MSNTLTAKAVAAFATVAMLASMLFALPARAQTVAELQAQIQSLLATIAQLQAQMAAMQGGAGTSATVPASTNPLCGYTFTENYRLGSRGEGVRKVQQFLNMDPDTRVAVAGPGSPGNETTYYGPATKRAVEKFQAKYASAILAPVGLSAPTGVWGPSTRAKANALLQAMCQAPAQQPGNQAQTPATTGVTVTAASQPDDTILPLGAQNIPFTRFTLTAGADDVEIESVVVKLEGLVDVDAFDSVFLLDENGNLIGNEESFDNDTRKAEVGDMFTLRAGQSKTFTVAANRSTRTNYAGQVGSISVVAINTDAPVHGTLPITGAQHTINETVKIASTTVEVQNNGGNVKVGDKDVELATVAVELENEDVYLKSLKLRQRGSADLKAALRNVTLDVEGEVYEADRVTSDYIYFTFDSNVMIETGNSDLVLSADIKGEDGRDLEFDIEEDADIVMVGKDYGYNADVTRNNPTGSAITIDPGELSLQENTDWDAAPVAAGENDAVIGSFLITVNGTDLVADVEIDVKQTQGAVATPLNNVAIHEDDGKGKPGKRISRTRDASFAAVPTTTTLYFPNVRFDKGEDQVMWIVADIDDNAQSDVEYQVTRVKVTDTDDRTRTDSITNLDAVEVNTGDLSVTVSNPDDTQVAADQEVVIAKIKFDASNSAYDAEIRRAELTLSVTGTAVDYTDVTNCRLYDDNGNSASETEDLSSTNKLTFNFPTNPMVDKGAIADYMLKCTLSADFQATDTVQLTNYSVDYKAGPVSDTVTGTATVGVTIANGQITANKTASNVNDNKAVKYGTEVSLGEFKIKAVDTRATIRGIQLEFTNTGTNAATLSNIRVKVNGSQQDVVASVNVAAGGTQTADFNDVSFNLDPNESATVEVLATVDTASTKIQITDVNVDLNNNGTYTGTGEPAAEDLSITGMPVVDVLNAVPVITQISLGSTLPNNDDTPVFAFKVRADGGDVTISDVAFKYDDANGVLSNMRLRIYDNPDRSGTYLDEKVLSTATAGYATSTGANITIPDGETYSFEVVADVGATGQAGLIRVMIEDDPANTVDFSAPTGKTAADFIEGDMKQRMDYDYQN